MESTLKDFVRGPAVQRHYRIWESLSQRSLSNFSTPARSLRVSSVVVPRRGHFWGNPRSFACGRPRRRGDCVWGWTRPIFLKGVNPIGLRSFARFACQRPLIYVMPMLIGSK